MRAILILLWLLAGCSADRTLSRDDPGPIDVSIAAISVESGRAVVAIDADRAVLPASTAKLVTALTVADRADLEHRFTTRLCRDGDAVMLIGGGDPSLDVEDLLALALAAKDGLHGATSFHYAPVRTLGAVNSGQPADAAYNPVLSGLMVAEGAFKGYRAGTTIWSVPDGGPVPPQDGEDWYAHPDPPRQAAMLFRTYAAGLGVDLPPPEPGPETCPAELARHQSDPVGDLIRDMLWTSSNAAAELLGRFATTAQGPNLWLADAHPDLADIVLENFSGLGEKSRVTARAMALLLAREAGREIGDAALPAILTPAGWDGGLRRRMTGPPAALAVWAKTGTMHYGVGLAGYVLHPRRGLLAFAAYAHDPVRRANYDPLSADPVSEVNARAWDRAARQAVDDAVTALLRE